MSSEKIPQIEFTPGEKRLLRYTLVTISAVILASMIGVIIWASGRIIGSLHALLLPLAIAGVMALVLFPVVGLSSVICE